MNANLLRPLVEPLEARIAPAALATASANFVKATIGAPIELHAGDLLTTTGVPNSGSYLLFVEQGNALVFFTDLNNNKAVDFNELTGIAAGDGFRMTCFMDIHGDIVTNLVEKTTTFPGQSGFKFVLSLSDSDSNASNDNPVVDGDGRVLLNKTIEKIEMRSLTIEDLPDQNNDGVVDDIDVGLRQVPSTYSIFGDIYAGKGFGAEDGGLIIDASALVNFGFEADTHVSVGSIRVGTAAAGQFFTFGASRLDDVSGTLAPFLTPRGQPGADIIGVHSVDPTLAFSIDGLFAGDGGVGARGGNISNVILNGDDTSGYQIVAGNGGRGPTGGVGGSITGFSDLGSDTSLVRIVTGTGGTGTTGTGGNAGDLTFDTFNVLGNVSIDLGDGGGGFKQGGNGASLLGGKFVEPTTSDVVVTNVAGTTHLPNGVGPYVARIGTHEAVDFDLDGIGDVVFTTSAPSQLVVAFGSGDPLTQYRSTIGSDGSVVLDRIYLPSPHDPDALVVADLNADGFMDIATASMDLGNHGGIYVYLSYFEDLNNDGVLTADEDVNANGRNDFVGFHAPIRSPLPLVESGDPDTSNAVFLYLEAPAQVSQLVAGDFNGDGVPELAALVTEYQGATFDASTGRTTGLAFPAQVLFYLQPDIEMNNLTGKAEYTGQFFADFGTKREEFPDPNGGPPVVIPAMPLDPTFFVIGTPPDGTFGKASIEATALSTVAGSESTFDVIMAGAVSFDAGGLVTIDYSDPLRIPTGPLAAAPLILGEYSLGSVDTNRGNDVNAVTFHYQASTVVDYDLDGLADAIAVSSSPDGFLVGVKGDGLGFGVQTSGDGANNSGNFLPDYPLIGGNEVGIKSVDVDGDGNPNEVAVIGGGGANFGLFAYVEGPGQAIIPAILANNIIIPGNVAFDFHHAVSTADLTQAFFIGGEAAPPFPANNLLNVFIPDGTILLSPMAERQFLLHAGDGGDALIGSGGRGGSIGAGSTLIDIIDPVTGLFTKDFQGSIEIIKSGRTRLIAGFGGDGFSAGGIGGSVTGVSLRSDGERTGAFLRAGDGGRGVTGKGGIGGDVANNSIFGGQSFIAGSGGPGIFGGKGGSVLGNGTEVFDTTLLDDEILSDSAILFVIAGAGGTGTRGGGTGGDILNFHPTINLAQPFGDLSYTAGAGGDAVSGKGGNGGSIRNSSPALNALMEGEVFLQAGVGGNGSKGGNGGEVTEFRINLAAQANSAAVVSVLGGSGGFGNKGNGGNGGQVNGIDVSSRGVPNFPFPLLSPYAFNRILGGDGGDSAQKKGGNGGDVANVRTSADQGGYAIVAGAGGDALIKGGIGGNLTNVDVTFGASTTAKGLFIAGDGGSATAFVDNPNDPNDDGGKHAFGGKVGKGGAGGSINGITQRGSIGAHIDLIAGNGGDVVNYGTISDPKAFVGKAGSILNVNLSGDVGNITPTVGIKSYNDVLNGETVADFVTRKFRDPLGTFGTALTDADGNVGIIVGAAGRNKSVQFDPQGNPFVYSPQPASNVQNGSLTNLLARNLMSAVAGSVDRIASIQVSKAIQILAGEVGSDKTTVGSFDYQDRNGNPITSPVPDGRLVDGALITASLVDANGNPTSLAGRVFFLPA